MMTMKSWFIAATALIIVGSLMFVGVMTAYGWDFTKLSNEEFETRVCDIDEDFSHISVDSYVSDIRFVKSDDGSCKVVYDESERVRYSIQVYDATLVIKSEGSTWNPNFGFFFKTPKMTVYLSNVEYDTIHLGGTTGDLYISNELSFEKMDISITTGNAEIHSPVSDSIKAHVNTGNIKVMNMTVGSLDLSSTTGNISVSDVNCGGNIDIDVTTGDVELDRTMVHGKIDIGTTTGDVDIEYSDAYEIRVSTGTGDVDATLLSGKIFEARSNTGSVHVPPSTDGGLCRISTNTGDITVVVV